MAVIEIRSYNVGEAKLGISGFLAEHSFLYYKDDSGQEFILRGGPLEGGNPLTSSIFVRVTDIDLSEDSPAKLAGVTVNSLQIANGSDIILADVWAAMSNHALSINSNDYPYDLFGQNSNTVIGDALRFGSNYLTSTQQGDIDWKGAVIPVLSNLDPVWLPAFNSEFYPVEDYSGRIGNTLQNLIGVSGISDQEILDGINWLDDLAIEASLNSYNYSRDLIADLVDFINQTKVAHPLMLNNLNSLAESILNVAGKAFVAEVGLTSGVFTKTVANLMAPRPTDPIVLDLAGTGIELTSIDDSSAYFDLHDTGFAVHTGWVGPNTGILVTPNLDGSVTGINNLFGSNDVDGFTAMCAIDSNGDGMLDSSDAGFSSLRVWVDVNGNGTADSGELKTLSELGIVSISLDPTPTNQMVNGNIIAALAHYTKSDNSTGQVAEAFFMNNQLASTYVGSYTLNPEVLLLPNQRGYGTLPDLFIAMSLDSTLLGMVQDLMVMTNIEDMNAQVRSIIYRWADVENVSPTGRGAAVDGQHLAILEKLIGHAWVDEFNHSDPSISKGLNQERAYGLFFTAVRNHLLAQGPLAAYFEGLDYNYAHDEFTGSTNFANAISTFGSSVPTTTLRAKGEYWISVISMLDSLAGELGVYINSYDTALQSVLSTAGLPSTPGAVHNLHFVDGVPDGNGNNIFEVTTNTIRGAIIEGLAIGKNILKGPNELGDAVFNNMQTLETSFSDLKITAAQLASFEELVSTASLTTIYATSGGTYDLSGLTLTGTFSFNARYAADVVTFIAPDTDTTFVDGVYFGSGVQSTMIGGNGNDTFELNRGVAGTTIIGGGGTDRLVAAIGDLSTLIISGVEILDTYRDIKMTASQFDGFSTFDVHGRSIELNDEATYDFRSKTVDTPLNVTTENSTKDITVYGNDDGMTISGGYGKSTFYGGTGNDVFRSGSGESHFYGGDGDDSFYMQGGLEAHGSIDGGTGSNFLYVGVYDITGLAISNIDNITIGSNRVRMTATQLASFTSLTSAFYVATVYAMAGTYDFTGKVINGNIVLSSLYATEAVTIIGSDKGTIFTDSPYYDPYTPTASIYAPTFIGGTGNDTFYIANPLAGTSVNGGGGTDTLQLRTNVDITQISVSNVEILETNYGVKLNTDQFDGFSTFNVHGSSIELNGEGTYDFRSKTVDTPLNVTTENSTEDVTVYGNDDGMNISGGYGKSTFYGGDGNDVFRSGSGESHFYGGDGDDSFYMQGGLEAHGSIDGGTGSNFLYVGVYDITGLSISNIDNITIGNRVRITPNQLASFTSLKSALSYATIYATAGTYDFTGKTLTGTIVLSSLYATEAVTIIGSNKGTIFTDSPYYDPYTLTASVYAPTFIGGSGGDTFYIANPLAGTSVDGGGGTDTLQLRTNVDITGISVSNVETLEASFGVKLTASQFDGFSTFNLNGSSMEINDEGTYDFRGKSIDTYSSVTAQNSSQDMTVYANDIGMTLYSGSGETNFYGGTGSDTVYITSSTTGVTADGGGGFDTFATNQHDISGYNISNFEKLFTSSSVKLTANQLAGFSTLVSWPTLLAASSGTYDLTNKTMSGKATLSAAETSSNVTFIGTGSGTYFYDGTGDNTFVGAGGSNDYYFNNGNGHDVIRNNAANNTASGNIYLSQASYDSLWFTQSGDDLLINKLGTTDSVTVKDWFGADTGAQTQAVSAGWSTLGNADVASLVSAMASFSGSNPGFDPTAATSMPIDTSLQTALAASWH